MRILKYRELAGINHITSIARINALIRAKSTNHDSEVYICIFFPIFTCVQVPFYQPTYVRTYDCIHIYSTYTRMCNVYI